MKEQPVSLTSTIKGLYILADLWLQCQHTGSNFPTPAPTHTPPADQATCSYSTDPIQIPQIKRANYKHTVGHVETVAPGTHSPPVISVVYGYLDCFAQD